MESKSAIGNSRRRDQRQFDEARQVVIIAGCVIDPLRRLSIIPGFGPEDVWYEGLGIAVVEREPARLDLYHNPVTRQKDMVRRGQGKSVEQGLVSRDGLGRLKALAIAATEDV